MKAYEAERIDELEMPVGESIELESLRQAVTPPYLMLDSFLETPKGVVIEEQNVPDNENGVHVRRYRLKAETPCEGELVIGFRDSQTGKVTHRKAIRVTAR